MRNGCLLRASSGWPLPSRTGRRDWCLLLLLLLGLGLWPAAPVQGQQLTSFSYTDSLIQALATQYRWAELDSVGRAALRLGTDYPALRRHLGQAALAQDRPALALRHYGRALRENPMDSTARHGLALAYLELNQPGPAALVTRGLADSLRGPLHLKPFQALTRVELEASGQQTNTIHRGDAGLVRLGVSSRLWSRFTLTQDFTHFGQTLELPDFHRTRFGERYSVRQNQYHALLGVQLTPGWRAQVGFTYLNSDLGRVEAVPGQFGYASLAYSRPYWTVQAGFFVGTLTDTARAQTDLRLTVYPLGNLRLYSFGRASVVRSAGRSYPNGVLGIGGRLHRKAWLEAFGGLGQVPMLAELDGTYVYNLFDPLRQRAGANLLILLSRALSWRLGYGAEQRRDAVNGNTYSLYSLSTALAWTW
ncbi:bacterial transcriptional activator domain-containing protein [Hymenobacter rubidus]|uniref:bacterial transcriptional activator domain-containing protein n=1 Tax=Hymenobacter rubidus TaxID=1441626 RepID=UPI00191E2BB2|nr:bacterial transcriptional activator domain-containing protein [Hymenobacter rubidus]